MKRRHLGLVAVVYVGLSLAFLAVPHSSSLKAVVSGFSPWIWVLGPPVLLVAAPESLSLYLVSTALVAAGVLLISRLAGRPDEWAIGVALIMVAAWCVFGFLLYIAYH